MKTTTVLFIILFQLLSLRVSVTSGEDKDTARGTTATTAPETNTETNKSTKKNTKVSAPCGPLKIFILAGQSNMAGMASIEHLKKLLDDKATHDEYAHLWNDTTKTWIERQDVFCKYDDNVGGLTVGFGSTEGNGGHFGPELGFGWVVGDELLHECEKQSNRPNILLLKTAWGGRDLAVDFRPPSSGTGNYDDVHPIKYGWEYRQMITDILTILDSLTEIVPGYDHAVGYELAGYVWFQGWNDLIKQPKVDEYESNLANLIRDVRGDLDAPGLPFIVGGMGQRGEGKEKTTTNGNNPKQKQQTTNEKKQQQQQTASGPYSKMQHAQRAVTLYDEFQNTTLYIPTGRYMTNHPDDGESYNGAYHYDGRADVYYHIGRAFGHGMLTLMGISSSTTGDDDDESGQ